MPLIFYLKSLIWVFEKTQMSLSRDLFLISKMYNVNIIYNFTFLKKVFSYFSLTKFRVNIFYILNSKELPQ